ncbi:MAG TPA: hypothetical protein VGK19_04245 [Capsulimonadaceae bacterium]|jgi:hypothetical protein
MTRFDSGEAAVVGGKASVVARVAGGMSMAARRALCNMLGVSAVKLGQSLLVQLMHLGREPLLMAALFAGSEATLMCGELVVLAFPGGEALQVLAICFAYSLATMAARRLLFGDFVLLGVVAG